MKAIDKDRHCRYASASEFATDIGRYLRNESVLASPPGVMYRTRKFVRRNRAAVFVFLVLIAGLATSIWQAMRVRLAEQQTQRIGALVLGPDPSDRNFTDVRSFAQAMFYTMKSMQVRIAKFEKMAESGNAQAAEQAINLRSQHKTLDDNYNRLLASLKMYGPKMTEEQKLVLRVTRIFGESELDMPKDFFAEVQKYIQLWKAKGRYLEYVRRAQQKGYAGGIAREFTSQGLPQQFFYLAMMESGFNEDAVGPKTSMGYAKGMWQFVPRTATSTVSSLAPWWLRNG